MIFGHPSDLGFAGCIHPPLHLMVFDGPVQVGNLEVWEIGHATALDAFEPERIALMMPVGDESMDLLELQVAGIVGFPSATEELPLPANLTPCGLP